MYKSLVTFSLILTCFVTGSTHASKCTAGSSTYWQYDQNKNEIILVEAFSQEVCSFIEKQANSNITIELLKKDKVIFKSEIYWANEVRSETHDGKVIKGVFIKKHDYKTLKFPVKKTEFDSFRVTENKTGKMLGTGVVK